MKKKLTKSQIQKCIEFVNNYTTGSMLHTRTILEVIKATKLSKHVINAVLQTDITMPNNSITTLTLVIK